MRVKHQKPAKIITWRTAKPISIIFMSLDSSRYPLSNRYIIFRYNLKIGKINKDKQKKTVCVFPCLLFQFFGYKVNFLLINSVYWDESNDVKIIKICWPVLEIIFFSIEMFKGNYLENSSTLFDNFYVVGFVSIYAIYQ